jgi:hypothetical protein
MDMPKVGPSHQKLYVLAGEWQGTETMMPSPMGPGGTATGTMKARVDIDGFYGISDYAQQRDGAVTYRGHGVYGFDTTTNEYTWYWIVGAGARDLDRRHADLRIVDARRKGALQLSLRREGQALLPHRKLVRRRRDVGAVHGGHVHPHAVTAADRDGRAPDYPGRR